MAELMIVDDDPDLPELLGQTLSADGHQFRVAHDGREGVERLAERPADLVLLDVEMPILNGPDTAYELFLRNCGLEKIPIVLLSGAVGLPEIAARVGTPYFLAKPYSANAVRRLTARALEERIEPHVSVRRVP